MANSARNTPHLTPYRYLSMPLLVLLAFFFLPFVLAFGISMYDYGQDLYAPQFIGLQNYQSLLKSGEFWLAIKNTAIFTLGVVPALVVLPVFLAVLVNQPLKGISVIRSLIYLPVVISMVVVGIAWKWLLQYDGLINYLLSFIGVSKIKWLVNPDIALVAIMMVVVWKGLAYYMMMYLSQLQTLSPELYEAAEIDGANTWQKHLHVTLPHLKPVMALVAVISTIGALKTFTEIYVMTRGGPVGATKTLVYYIYQRAFENLDLGIASAAGIIMMFILLVVSAIQIKVTGGNQLEEIKPSRHK